MLESSIVTLKIILANVWIKALLILIGSMIFSILINILIKLTIIRLTRRTVSDVDDRIVENLRTPIFLSVILIGLIWAAQTAGIGPATVFILLGSAKSTVIIVWTLALGRISKLFFQAMEKITRFTIIQPRTVPIFNIFSMILIWGGACYLTLLTWHIDITGWLASAGVVGIAVGFAAKDTLANLFSGFFILADAPYKLGDFIVLGSGERGLVTDIGIRSTRILTRDDIEIIVPNAVIAATKITNESGGPHTKKRIRCTVSVAYGSDVEQVKQVLMSTAKANQLISKFPYPRVRFRSFGDSGLVFQLLAWIDEPALRGRALDSLHTEVYNNFNAAEIEIPYNKYDVYIKENV